MREHPAHDRHRLSALLFGLVILLASLALCIWGTTVTASGDGSMRGLASPIVVTALTAIASFLTPYGLTEAAPVEARVLRRFGHHAGTFRTDGLLVGQPVHDPPPDLHPGPRPRGRGS